jgi:hypothetical protein
VCATEREAKDEELLRDGVTSRRYLAHFKRLSKQMQKLERSGGAVFKWLDDDETRSLPRPPPSTPTTQAR